MSINEFSLIEKYFKTQASSREDVLFGIGDDAAGVEVPPGKHLVISTDTLVSDTHFVSSWDPYIIAWKAVMVNISDIAAMGATPCWVSLALTLPSANESWLSRFSEGLHAALQKYNIALIGGDTTKGPLSLTITIHGQISKGKAILRSGAKVGDAIWVSGDLGAAALAVNFLEKELIDKKDQDILMEKLLYPTPRTDLGEILQDYATAAIDISDGLSADLNHICTSSQVGAKLFAEKIPVHHLVHKYHSEALVHALSGGDDYELCFTIPKKKQNDFIESLKKNKLLCFPIGIIEKNKGLRLQQATGEITALTPKGYSHF